MSLRRIRLLYCTGDFKAGGTQRYLLNLVRRLDQARFDITIACLSEEGPLLAPTRATGVPVECFPIRHPLWDPRSIAQIVSLARRIRGNFDLVHTLLGHANVVGLLAARAAGHRRVLASQRNLHPVYGSFRSGSPALVTLGRWLFRHAARRVVVNSPVIAEALVAEGLPADRIVTIPGGVDVDRFRPAPDRAAARRAAGLRPDAPVIGFVGRLIPDKGIHRFLEAATALAGEFPDLHCIVVGEGPSAAACREAADTGPLRSRIRLEGFRDDLDRVYPLLDVLAFPSTYSEGMPNVVLEAMSCAVPVVAHRLPQTEAIVRDGVTGALVDSSSPGSLAAALLRLLQHSNYASALGAAARAHVEAHHSLDTLLQGTTQLYEMEACLL